MAAAGERFGGELRRRRLAAGLSQEALAERAGLSARGVSDLERGLSARPHLETVRLLADALGLADAERTALVAAARPAAPPEEPPPVVGLPAGTVAFLAADVEGSTRLWEADPRGAKAALGRALGLLREAVAAHGGAVHKEVGDALHAAFPTAPAAVAAALAAQRALAAEPWSTAAPVRVRMAVHAATAHPDPDGEYRAPALNRLARLLSAGHGGQTLLSQAAAELARDELPAGTALRDLGEQRLHDLFRPERAWQLLAPDLPRDFPPLATLAARPNNLPAQPTPLVGREREAAEVVALLGRGDVRLLTLTGPGGVGKTRLALQAAADLLDAFPDGCWFVDLAPLADPALVASAVAGALGVREAGGRALTEVLADVLREKCLLMILDNCEHLPAMASRVVEFLRDAPNLKILATSRAPLRLRGEREYPVPPLAVPDPRRLPALERLSQYAAVRLFVERAVAARPDFAVTNANAPAVAEICARLDGLPLAIELAAARVKLLPPEALLKRLSSRLTVVTGGARDLPARQRTLRDAIAWSHDLLTGEEQRLFRRLAVFAGGGTVEAAEAVAGSGGELDVLGGLAALVDHSLLRQVEGPGGEPRFAMLETVREYALERLQGSGEADEVRRRHAEQFLALAEEVEPRLTGSEQETWVHRLQAEHDNLRAALGWTLEHEAEAALRLAGALFWLWWTRGQLSEGRRWLEQALGRGPDVPSPARAKALTYAGVLAWAGGDHERASSLAEAGLTTARAVGDAPAVAHALLLRGNLATEQGDPDGAAALHDEALSRFRALGDTWGAAIVLNQQGEAARRRGDADRAAALYREALRRFRELGAKPGIALALQNLGMVALARHENGEAAMRFAEALRLAHQIDDGRGIEMCLEGFAALSPAQRAARLLGAAEVLRERVGTVIEAVDRPQHEHTVGSVCARLGEAAFAAAWAAGRALPPEAAVAEALALADELAGDSADSSL